MGDWLNKHDIESLGWVDHEDIGMSENYGGKFGMSRDGVLCILNVWYTKHDFYPGLRLNISCIETRTQISMGKFEGYIKTKYELSKLMQQLNIK